MSYDPTDLALQSFIATETVRSTQKATGQPVAPRVLLKLVGKGSTLHLEARPDTTLERLKTLFMRKDYKLENIKKFISKLSSQEAALATSLIDKKIETRKPSSSLFKIFHKALFGTTESRKPPTDPFAKAPTAPTNPLFVQAPLAGNIPEELRGQETELLVSKSPGYGMENPNTACYLNSTSQALRQSPSFKEFLMIRRKGLEQILEQTAPDVTPEKLQIEVQAFSDVVYDKAKTDLPLAIYFVQEHQSKSDYAKGIVQLALINKLQQIYTKLESGTVDENTVQSFRALVIASGFIDVDTTLSSQEDAAAMLAHLLTSIGSQPFNFKTAISYQSNFSIPMLDMQDNNQQNFYPIALMDVAPETSIQDLVVERKVNETIEKNDIVKRNDFFDRNPAEMEEILHLQDNTTVQTTQTLTFTKGQEPKLLPVNLKRYDFTPKTGATKNKVAINPSLTLDVPIEGKNEVARYRLLAVTVHHGATLKSGHFFTYAAKPDNSWVEYNDSHVSEKTYEVALEDIKQNAYMYYYEYVENVPSESILRGRIQARA